MVLLGGQNGSWPMARWAYRCRPQADPPTGVRLPRVTLSLLKATNGPPGGPPLPSDNDEAPGCPLPGVAAGASRTITRWRQDRERLAAYLVHVDTVLLRRIYAPIIDVHATSVPAALALLMPAFTVPKS
jgi:hypothetical protein